MFASLIFFVGVGDIFSFSPKIKGCQIKRLNFYRPIYNHYALQHFHVKANWRIFFGYLVQMFIKARLNEFSFWSSVLRYYGLKLYCHIVRARRSHPSDDWLKTTDQNLLRWPTKVKCLNTNEFLYFPQTLIHLCSIQ